MGRRNGSESDRGTPAAGGGRPLKRWAQAASALLGMVFLRRVAYRIARRVQGEERAFSAASESIARIPGSRGVYARQAFYRRTLAACGRDVYFGWMSVFSKPASVVGDSVYIGRHCSIGWVELGAGAMISDGVQILSGGRQHGLATAPGRRHQDEPLHFERVTVGEGAWLGAGAIVLADVGEGSIVGAGAVVTSAIPPASVAVGVPARVVRRLEPVED